MNINLKIKKPTLNGILILLSILAMYHFYYLIDFPDIIDTVLRNTNLSIIIYIFTISLYLLFYKSYKRVTKEYVWLDKYFLILSFTFLLIYSFTAIKYDNQSPVKILCQGARLLLPTMIPLYLKKFQRDGGPKKTFELINNIAIIWTVLIIVQSFIYDTTGNIILDFNTLLVRGVSSRANGIRISGNVFINIMAVYNYFQIFNKNDDAKIKYFIYFILDMYAIVFVCQTRAFIFIVILCLLVQAIFMVRTKRAKKIEIVVLFVAIISLFASGYAQNMANDFIQVDVKENHASVNNRMYALTYYGECFRRNPIFGNGIVAETDGYRYVEHGPLGKAYYSDVGFIGLLAETGLCSIVFFFYPLFKIIKSYRMIRKRKDNIEYDSQFVLPLLVYIIATSFSLIVTDAGRAIAFPLYIAYFIYTEKSLELER